MPRSLAALAATRASAMRSSSPRGAWRSRCGRCTGRSAYNPPRVGHFSTWRTPTDPANSTSVIAIFVPDDVVLAQIAAGLDFDEVQRLVGRILQPVLRAERNESRFVFAHFVNPVVARHARPAGDDDPVFRALAVHL